MMSVDLTSLVPGTSQNIRGVNVDHDSNDHHLLPYVIRSHGSHIYGASENWVHQQEWAVRPDSSFSIWTINWWVEQYCEAMAIYSDTHWRPWAADILDVLYRDPEGFLCSITTDKSVLELIANMDRRWCAVPRFRGQDPPTIHQIPQSIFIGQVAIGHPQYGLRTNLPRQIIVPDHQHLMQEVASTTFVEHAIDAVDTWYAQNQEQQEPFTGQASVGIMSDPPVAGTTITPFTQETPAKKAATAIPGYAPAAPPPPPPKAPLIKFSANVPPPKSFGPPSILRDVALGESASAAAARTGLIGKGKGQRRVSFEGGKGKGPAGSS